MQCAIEGMETCYHRTVERRVLLSEFLRHHKRSQAAVILELNKEIFQVASETIHNDPADGEIDLNYKTEGSKNEDEDKTEKCSIDGENEAVSCNEKTMGTLGINISGNSNGRNDAEVTVSNTNDIRRNLLTTDFDEFHECTFPDVLTEDPEGILNDTCENGEGIRHELSETTGKRVHGKNCAIHEAWGQNPET